MQTELATSILSLTGRPDRATDRMCKAIELAVVAANELGDVSLDSRHLLCGLVREAEGVGYHVLAHLNVTREKLDATLLAQERNLSPSRARLDDDLAIAMTSAADGATSLNHSYIGTEHLLLGVVAPGTKSVKLLADLGVSDESVAHEVRRLRGHLP